MDDAIAQQVQLVADISQQVYHVYYVQTDILETYSPYPRLDAPCMFCDAPCHQKYNSGTPKICHALQDRIVFHLKFFISFLEKKSALKSYLYSFNIRHNKSPYGEHTINYRANVLHVKEEHILTLLIRLDLAAKDTPLESNYILDKSSRKICLTYLKNGKIKAESDWHKQPKLTPIEQEVVILASQNYSSQEIASILNDEVQTIGTIRKRIFEKLGVHGMPQAVIYCKVHGIITVDNVMELERKKKNFVKKTHINT